MTRRKQSTRKTEKKNIDVPKKSKKQTGEAVEMSQKEARMFEEINDVIGIVLRREPMTPEKYMAYYTNLFNFLSEDVPFNDAKDEEYGREPRPESERLMYDMIKEKIKEHTKLILKKLDVQDGVDLLNVFMTEWENFRFSARVIDGVYTYLNRHWTSRSLRKRVEYGIKNLYMMCVLTFEREVYSKIAKKLMSKVFKLIRAERLGTIINTKHISAVLEFLVDVGRDNAKDSLLMYRTAFEDRLLRSTPEFYEHEASEFLGTGRSVKDYIKKVKKRLEEENNRAQLYLHPSTKAPLLAKCTAVLIAKRLRIIKAQFVDLLAARNDDDLHTIFQLCSEVKHGLDGFPEVYAEFVANDGLTAMQEVAEQAFTDPRLYVTTLVGVYKRYRNLVKDAFENKAGFLKALDKATAKFINSNAVTDRAPLAQKYTKTAELLARYVDSFLRKSSKNPEESELEELLNDSISAFKFVEDKDVFLRYYTRLFTKRLIGGVSASDEAEQSYISKLKEVCGFEYTARLMKMTSDIQMSTDLTKEMMAKTAQTIDRKSVADMSALVLRTAFWPEYTITNLNLPRELSSSLEAFSSFYKEKHSGRRLTWVYSQSRGEIECIAFSRKCIFSVTVAQICTLCLFNSSDAYSFNDISEATKMDAKTTAVIVGSLVKCKLLTSDIPLQGDEAPNTATVSFNNKYSSKKVRVDLTKFSVKADKNKEQEGMHKTFEADRINEINACIVRIMKTQKECSHQPLTSEIISQLSSRFKPQIEMIKKCIGSLIDKEYIKRDDTNKDVYQYIA
ncbi:unnamed protein product [Caenorhabditis sp. 36 PRJEB53466]|nr:unnamed protein product [Caenorhabditis sp. 36 PRJEB53466]